MAISRMCDNRSSVAHKTSRYVPQMAWEPQFQLLTQQSHAKLQHPGLQDIIFPPLPSPPLPSLPSPPLPSPSFSWKELKLVPSFSRPSLLLARRTCTFINIQYAVALLTKMGYRLTQKSSEYHLRFRTYAG